MKARFRLEHPMQMEATVIITMPLRDWETLKKQLSQSWPNSELSRVISELITKAQREFCADQLV